MSSAIEDYKESLRTRGRCEATIQSHNGWVTRFLTGRNPEVQESDIRIEEVDAFLTLWLPSLSRRSRSTPLAALRGFLNFLYQQGLAQTDLSPLIIGVRIYRNEFLPQGLARAEIKRVLEHIDRSSPNGSRDYAVLLLMGTYGLRVSEVVALTLDSMDWEHDKIRVERPKTRDRIDLPLLSQVGNAIVDYLQRERPTSDSDALFVFPQKLKTCVIAKAVQRYLRKAGLESHGHLTSLFRHSLAMEMVSQGVAYKGIADVLGHRHLASTYVYAKSDVEGLRAAALPAVGGNTCLPK